MNLNVIEVCLFECGLPGSFLRRFWGRLPDPFPNEKSLKFPNFQVKNPQKYEYQFQKSLQPKTAVKRLSLLFDSLCLITVVS